MRRGSANMPQAEAQPRQHPLHQSLKCFYPGTAHAQLQVDGVGSPSLSVPQECIRIFVDDIHSIEELKALVYSELNITSVCKFCYLDDDGDLVSFTGRTTLEELEDFALSIHVYTLPNAQHH